MPGLVKLRPVTAEEEKTLRRLAASRTEPASLVQRARLICLLLDTPSLPATRAALKAGFAEGKPGTVWVKRFNTRGVAGLQEAARSGRPPVHTPEVKSRLIDLALRKPSSLGLPFELWTLERLQIAFRERTGTHLSDSTIWTWLRDEGLEWKRQQSWFRDPERHDPEFVEKRGPLLPPISSRRKTAVSSA
jgi:transposase